jgi:hypothetical protein
MMAAAAVAGLGVVSSALAQSNVGSNQVVISIAGSTALKNWLVAKTTTFTDVQPGGTLSIDGTTYPPGGTSYWNNGVGYQLAPSNNTSNSSTVFGATNQIQFVYHESGSVEGILEMANDQLYTNSDYAPSTGIASTSIPYVTANIDRNPDSGNAVWLNYNQIGNSGTTGGTAWSPTSGASVNNLTLGNFYGTGIGQGSGWSSGNPNNPTPTFNQQGANLNGGQYAVQAAMSDAIPQQVFANNYGNTSNTYTPLGSSTPVTVTGTANSSWNSSPLDLGYGSGNSALSTGSLGTAGSKAVYQSPGVLNMPADAQNPRAPVGTTFGVGAWNDATNGGLGNLNSQFTAVTATTFVANPGTGLSELNRTDADWLELNGRLANGATFNATTRDVNSGTRDVAALDTGIDPTWATGKNDNGNGNLANGATNTGFSQTSIGPDIRFSNKTAGGAQLRPTVQDNRMSVGTLSINDASSVDLQSKANAIQVLSYADTASGYTGAVSPNYQTISNGTYVIYQNEQVVTLKAPGADYGSEGVTTNSGGAQILNGPVQGDDADGDLVALLNNTATSVATGTNPTSPADPADGLEQQGYLVPSLMQVEKNFNGQGLTQESNGGVDQGSIVSQANPSYNAAAFAAYSSGYGPSALPVLGTVTTGSGSTYGGAGSSQALGTGVINGDTNGSTSGIGIDTTNYIFGNFNQNGIRDFSAVKSAVAADQALIGADITAGATVPGSEFTAAADGDASGTSGLVNSTLIAYTSQDGPQTLQKGDLIVMGDYTGDGHFDGADLVAMAEGVALSDNSSVATLTSSATMYQTGVLDKNQAFDYMNSTIGDTTAADQYIRKTGAAVLEGTAIPAGATPVYVPGSSSVVQTDPIATAEQGANVYEYTYDPTGVNTFNKSDVNRDGTVDFNDAVIVDNENGQDYTSLADQTAATIQSPVTGTPEPFNLVMAKQSDGSSVIGASDVSVVNTQLTGTGTTNWYGYNLQKTGPSTIIWERTGGQVNVYPNASFEISSGTVQIGSSSVSGTIDPFSGTGPTAGNHVSVTLDHGGQLVLASDPVTYTVGGLSIDPTTGSAMDLGDNTVIVNGASISTIRGYLIAGYNDGSWNGPGIFSSAVASQNTSGGLQYGIGWASGSDGTHAVSTLSSGQVELRYTLLGDANLDGTVNGSDFSILAANFGLGVTNWDQGNFLYGSSVNGSDFSALAANFGQGDSYPGGGGSPPSDVTAADVAALDAFAAANGLTIPTVAAVPEPATISVVALAGAGLLARRRRR